MDRRLLRYYDLELQHLRNMGVGFAREFPRIAGRLGLPAVSIPADELMLPSYFGFLTAVVTLDLAASNAITRLFGVLA